ncbi:MAG: DUF3369 domain-containing protein [SAR324 cluster bacterium]|nr:DUF3369 domain-containing protein [SAR324 cluster bacterium]
MDSSENKFQYSKKPLFAPRQASSREELATQKWKVLIVDDAEEIHLLTKMVLRNFTFMNRGLEFISAYSGAESRKIILQHSDIAVILLDVVMEEDDSGLKVVRFLRNELQNQLVRIVLRTGQPGQAPEEKVIVEYDINDYKAKTELTAPKLFTTMFSALRSYRDLMTIENNRRSLEKIIESSCNLYNLPSMRKFASGSLSQIVSILNLSPHSIYCHVSNSLQKPAFDIIAATGKYETQVHNNLSEILNVTALNDCLSVVHNQKNMYSDHHYIGYFQGQNLGSSILFLESQNELTQTDWQLLDFFSLHIKTAYSNLDVKHQLVCVLERFMNIMEEFSRNQNHFEKISHFFNKAPQYAHMLALRYGLSEDEAKHLKNAASVYHLRQLLLPSTSQIISAQTTEDYSSFIQSAITITLQTQAYQAQGVLQVLNNELHLYTKIVALANDLTEVINSSSQGDRDLDSIKSKLLALPGTRHDPELMSLLLEHLDVFLEV